MVARYAYKDQDKIIIIDSYKGGEGRKLGEITRWGTIDSVTRGMIGCHVCFLCYTPSPGASVRHRDTARAPGSGAVHATPVPPRERSAHGEHAACVAAPEALARGPSGLV